MMVTWSNMDYREKERKSLMFLDGWTHVSDAKNDSP